VESAAFYDRNSCISQFLYSLIQRTLVRGQDMYDITTEYLLRGLSILPLIYTIL